MTRILDNIQLFQRDTMVKSLALKGVGANETLRRLKDVGLGMRRTDLLAAYREYAKIPAKAEKIKYVRKDYQIGRELYTEPMVTASGKPAFMSEAFRYTVRFETFNPDTRETRELFHSMVSRDSLTPRQIEENFIDSLTDTVDRYKLVMSKYSIESGEHRPGDPWEL